MFSNKTVLITGATGLIGSHLVDAFMNMNDVRVIALGRSKAKLISGFAEYLGDPRFRYLAQDVSEPLCLENGQVDYIFHAAGPMEGNVIKNSPVDVVRPNIVGTLNCLDFLRHQEECGNVKGRLVLFSSVTVYGNNTDADLTVAEPDTRVTEALDAGGAPYSQSKRMSEVIVQAYCRQYDVDAVIARLSTVYGCTRFIPDTAFFEFVRKSVAGEDIVLNASGFARRDNIYIDDAVRGLLLIAEKGLRGEAYNVSSNGDQGNFAAVDEIAQAIVDVANDKYGRGAQQRVGVRSRAGSDGNRKPGLRLDNAKLKQLGWSVQTSLHQGIVQTLDEYTGQ